MGDVALQTSVVLEDEGRYSAIGAPGLGDLGALRRVRGRHRAACRRGREPVRPARQLLLPLPLGGRLRAGGPRRHAPAARAHRAGAAGRNDAGRSAGARRHGLVGRPGRGPRARRRHTARGERSGGHAALGRPPARRGRGDGDDDRRPYAFWDNFEQRPIDWSATWPPPGPLPPTWRTWVRYKEGDPAVGGRLGAGRPAARRARRRELAGRLAAARPCQPALHRAQPRSLRRLPGSDERIRVAAARRALPGGPGRTALVDGPGLVRGRARLLASGGGQAVFRHT